MEREYQGIIARFQEVERLVADPEVFGDRERYIALAKERKELEPVVQKIMAYKAVVRGLEQSRTLIEEGGEEGLIALAEEEQAELQTRLEVLEGEIKELLLPKDPDDNKSAILELRAGIGGSEAGLWVGDLFRMYQRYAERKGWKLDVVDFTESPSGGYKEVICNVGGVESYGMLKYESGVHRVQRVPATEAQGRVHTSAASVVVLPEVDDVSVVVDKKDVRKDTFCSSGPGGQSVNTTYSAIRLTHIPTGIVVSCQDEKSQLKNFDKAMKVLAARLYEKAVRERAAAVGGERRAMVGSGDRSEKIRTYNYPQGRVTDHRIGYSVQALPYVLDGNLDEVIEALRLADRKKRLEEGGLVQRKG